MMNGIEFYLGNMPNQSGETIHDVWKFTDTEYEGGHNFIQWIFPSDEVSSVNPYAPVVDTTFREIFLRNIRLRVRLKHSYALFLAFLGLVENKPNGAIHVFDHGKYYLRVLRPNHNLQRITRVIRCLNLLGLHSKALPFYEFLMNTDKEHGINPITVDYWHDAMTIVPLAL